ncbi:MAG: peptidyl-prolyl cis-trans isomerase [Acidobacteria bacterium]|nr:peptidyl-prolyl cis-trans isomerase [Acidobacteriota bacterium]
MNRGALVAAALLALPGCRGAAPGGEPAGGPVAAAGDEQITPAEFERYLRRETGVGPAEIDGAAKKLLLEELIAEELLAFAAEGEGLTPPAEDVDAEVRQLQSLGAGGTPEELRHEALRRLRAELYERAVLAPAVRVQEDEVERTMSARADPGAGSVAFRQILAENRADAERARERVTRRGESFEDVAQQISVAPDKGTVQSRRLDQLPEPAASALRRLQPGQTSDVLALGDSFYLFRLEARVADPDPGRARERADARSRLEQDQLEKLRAARLAELASRHPVTAPGLPGQETTR